MPTDNDSSSSGAPAAVSVSWPDPERRSAFERWLAPLAAAHGLRLQTLRPASADASFRRYLRIDAASGPSLIVMMRRRRRKTCGPSCKSPR